MIISILTIFILLFVHMTGNSFKWNGNSYKVLHKCKTISAIRFQYKIHS